MRKLLCGIVLVLLSSMVFAVPPGLEKKGMTTAPSFLGKTPPGWDQGVKRGWNKDKDWKWNKSTNLWENKDWQWDRTTKSWERRH